MRIGKPSYRDINTLLNQKLEERGVLIAVHRGTSLGNIIENTIPALKAAIQHGGDMLEVDVCQSTDGIMYLFHDGAEPRLLKQSDNIKTMDSEKIESLTYYNRDYTKIDYKVERLDDLLSTFKGDTLINIDRAWDIWPALLKTLDKYEVSNQILLKGPVVKEQLEFLDQYETKYMFMPIVHSLKDIETALAYPNLNLVGLELIADSENHPLFQDALIEKLHQMNLFVWANAITLDDKTVLFGGLDDDTSIMQDPDQGWGKLFEKNIDFIQTDWPTLLASYRDKKIGLHTNHR
ncbi:glycerophosphodiester phosphodiesterase [Paenibacillus elgii]|uniref:Glycerophosphodiester phosphodiesterase n=1 Tax=Paenibacillus elgii TaxID=189691 RepID=A0A2T6G993_9BACL|nr:glycerophosphodiester phosphodiesterase family protein [Paenibacillus elgii]PUA40705.1 glycerophosphodiester phosphodiesterase [Paenibacillus elgii]